MSISSEITRLQNAKASIKTSIEGKGVTVPSATTLDGYSTLIDSIQTGGAISDYFNSSAVGGGVNNPPTVVLLIKKVPGPITITSSASNLFYGCKSLIEAPVVNSTATSFTYMFYNCSSLVSVPQFDTSTALYVDRMFYGCSSLTTIPLLDFGNVTSLQDMLKNSSKITDLGGFKDLGKAYLTTASANYSNYTLNIPGTKATHDSMMNVINNLYDIKTKGCQMQKIIVTSTVLNRLSVEERAIATAKGWTIATS